MDDRIPVVTLVPLTRALGRVARHHRQVLKAAQADGVLVDAETPEGYALLSGARLPWLKNRYWVPEGCAHGLWKQQPDPDPTRGEDEEWQWVECPTCEGRGTNPY